MTSERQASPGRVDWWPLTRMLITGAILGLAAHVLMGWQVRPQEILLLAGQMFGVLAILAMISFVLADLYLLVFLGPLYILAVANDWFYLASVRTGRTIFRLRSPLPLAIAGLCGEIALFALCLSALVRLAARF